MRAWYPCFHTLRSVPHVRATFTRTRRSSGPIGGIGTFSTFKSSRPYSTAAIMCPLRSAVTARPSPSRNSPQDEQPHRKLLRYRPAKTDEKLVLAGLAGFRRRVSPTPPGNRSTHCNSPKFLFLRCRQMLLEIRFASAGRSVRTTTRARPAAQCSALPGRASHLVRPPKLHRRRYSPGFV